ncbi:stimulated by retinoic acid gene 8 protein homolog [Brienomyrus brachyistius]|uniref:stimulated by retinoic acid gene 8 protein homolog n=1 Tax=Brienomyrus brachyistius TaxID=42636 RepID=UPI0020B2E961|nr:stimulated by retinoic acid gene 8 protein homolog [Brienomyrus brachyistius]
MWNKNQRCTMGRGKRRGSGRRGHGTDRQRERRRVLQARHRAAVGHLFDNLRKAVLPASKKAPAKWKILKQAKHFLQQRESLLSRLLSLKETFLGGEDGPLTLEEVREEYRSRHPLCSDRAACQAGSLPVSAEVPVSSEDEDPGQSQSCATFSPSILEFEGYLSFYRQTVELLQHRGVLCMAQAHLPAVSQAVSALWRSLPPERRATFQTCSPGATAQLQTGSPQGLSQTNSQGASGSSGSTFEEDLFQDAYEVVQREMDSTSEDSPQLETQEGSNLSCLTEICRNLVCFIKTQTVDQLEIAQDLCLPADYETVFLRCTETFDDEDL